MPSSSYCNCKHNGCSFREACLKFFLCMHVLLTVDSTSMFKGKHFYILLPRFVVKASFYCETRMHIRTEAALSFGHFDENYSLNLIHEL